MRAFTVLISPNVQNLPIAFDAETGNPILMAPGRPDLVSLDVTASVIEVGPWQRQIEKELTKIAPSEQVVKIIDEDGSIWEWLITNFPSLTSSWQRQIMSGIGSTFPINNFPPYLSIDLYDAGTDSMKRAFTGIIENKAITRDQKTNVITFNPKDWSCQLANKPLAAAWPQGDANPLLNPWLRPKPQIGLTGITGTSQICNLTSLSYTPQGYNGIFWTGPGFLKVGSKVTTNLHSSYSAIPADKQYTVTSVGQVIGPSGPIPNWYCAQLDGLGQEVWDHIHQGTIFDLAFTVQCLDPTQGPVDYFTVAVTVMDGVTGNYILDLDTVDGIVSGDVLTTINGSNSQTWTVVQVDAENNYVTCMEEVANVQTDTTHIYWDTESSNSLVLEDARVLIKRAVLEPWNGYAVNFDRWVPQTLKDPLLMWLPLRPDSSNALTTVVDVDCGLTDLRVFGANSKCWKGNPEDGWAVADGTTARAPWTEQLTSAPASTMPWEAATIAPHGLKRNSVSWVGSRERSDGARRTGVPGVSVVTPEKVWCYDYQTMSRVVCTNSGSTSSIVITHWTGTGWNSPASAWNWPQGYLWSLQPLIGHPGYLVGFSLSGIKVVKISDHSVSNTHRVPPAQTSADIKSTPWSNYLVGSMGYGKITWNSSTNIVDYTWVTLGVVPAATMFPTTFQGITATECCMLGRITAIDPSGKSVTETHLFILNPSPGNTIAGAVLNDERLLDGAPSTVGAVRDPTLAGRVIGHCGGRLFSISRTVTQAIAIERVKPLGMKAMDLIEQICQITNTIAVPDPLGTLYIISRAEEPVTEFHVDQTEVIDTYIWENFFSIVRVSTANDKTIYADAFGPAGGDILTIDQHPMIFTQSGCRALANQLSIWMGRPRKYQEVKWFWTDPDTPAPWESLAPLAVITVNSDPTPWIVYGLVDDKFKGVATVKLVEAFPT